MPTQLFDPACPGHVDGTLPDTLAQEIQRRTGGGIRALQVSRSDQNVTLTGTTTRYYYKQLATAAVHEQEPGLTLSNEIAVLPR